MTNKTRRIIHHACWFALLGPHIGVPVTIVGEMLDSHNPAHLLLEILSILPLFIVLTWWMGGLAALLTGIAAACLPSSVYCCTWKRTLACGLLGSVIASVCCLFIFTGISKEFLRASTGPGLLAGLVMGWLVPRLPLRGDKKRVNQEDKNLHADVV